MAERKAVNKYYPPGWDPSKGSVNKYQNSHPLRERARKLDQGILVIRFELPFNIWCNGCANHVGMGVRYNAEKSKTGMYYTTPIYKFRMKCHLCDNHFEIQTDPANRDYVILNGARRQERRWEAADNEHHEVDKDASKKLSLDPMFKLEHQVIDNKKASDNKNRLAMLEDLQSERWEDDYTTNCSLRRTFRNRKREHKKIAEEDVSLLTKSSLPVSLRLMRETPTDVKLAKLMKLHSTNSIESNKIAKRKELLTESIFANKKDPPKDGLLKLRISTRTSTPTSQAKPNRKAFEDVKIQAPKPSTSTSAAASCLVEYSSDESE